MHSNTRLSALKRTKHGLLGHYMTHYAHTFTHTLCIMANTWQGQWIQASSAMRMSAIDVFDDIRTIHTQ